MEPLPVVSMDCSAEGLLRYLLRACHSSHGLLAFRPTAEAADALHDLRSTVSIPWGSEEVAPHTAAEAAAALHELGERFTKATAQRLGLHSYALHPFCDDLPDWLHPADGGAEAGTQSVILLSCRPQLGEHLDRGLFNLVLGTPADLAGIQLNLAGEQVGVKALLPAAAECDLLGLLIPGYTLQCLDPRTPAVPHSVYDASSYERCTVVLQWRLRPDFQVAPGVPLSLPLSQFETSARMQRWEQQRHAAACFQEQHREEGESREAAVEACGDPDAQFFTEPATPGSKKYSITVKTLAGKNIQIRAHRSWTGGNLKWVINQREGIPPDQQRIIFSGKQLEAARTLEAYRVTNGSTLHLVLRLGGD